MKPLVSVLMPVYNSEPYLDESIKSILNQSYENFELIIVDDGSSDKSLEVINKYLIQDKRVKLYQNDTNMGLPYTRNKTLNLSNGDFIAIMDSDDISLSNRLERQINYFIEHPEVTVLSTDYVVFGRNKKNIHIFRDANNILQNIDLIFNNKICNSTTMIRKKFLIENKISYDLGCSVAQDYKLWTEISLKNGKFAHLNEMLVKYRYGHENITNKSLKKIQNRREILFNIYKNYINGLKINITDEEIYLFTRFFSDISSKEIIRKEDVERIIRVFNKMNKSLEVNQQLYFMDKFNKEIYYSIVGNNYLTFKQKIRNLKILYGSNIIAKINIKLAVYYHLKIQIKKLIKY